jgi:hypothetical protein
MHVYLDAARTDLFGGHCCVAVLGEGADAIQVSRPILDAWSAEELAAHGLVRATVTTPALADGEGVLTGAYVAEQAADGAWLWVAQVRPLDEAEQAERDRVARQVVSDTALRALADSDRTVMRCYEAAIPLPADWVAYRLALRAIVGTGVGPLPARPDYPAGT